MTVDEEVVRLRFDGLELDEADARLTRAGQPVPLPPRPFAVLCTLARSPGRPVTKNARPDSVWGHRFVTESVLKSVISEVRAALADLIRTVATALEHERLALNEFHRRPSMATEPLRVAG